MLGCGKNDVGKRCGKGMLDKNDGKRGGKEII